MTIDSFHGEYEFLSNFYEARFIYREFELPTVEHGFQAFKANNAYERDFVLSALTPMEAKSRGRHVFLRPDWEDVKNTVMRHLLFAKFTQNDLAEKLVGTGDAWLVEGNTWGDTYWGVSNGRGMNWLGALLMELRTELKLVVQ